MRRDGLLALSSTLLFACGDGGPLFVELPDDSSRSAIIVLEGSGRSPEAWVYDTEDAALPIVLPETLDRGELADLHLALYPRPVATLWSGQPSAITTGQALTPPEADELALGLPEGGSIFSAQVEDGAFSGWDPRSPPPRALAELSVGAGVSLCPSFASSSAAVLLELGTVSFVALDSTHVLAISGEALNARGYVLTATSSVEIDLGIPMAARPGATAMEPSGRIWIGGEAGQLWSGTVESGFAWTSTAPDESGIRGIAIRRVDPQTSMFIVAENRFLELDGATWTTVHRRGISGSGNQLSRIAAPSADEAFVTIEDEVLVHHYRDGEIVAASEVDNTGIRALVDAGPLGVFATSAAGRLFRFQDATESWEVVPGMSEIEANRLQLLDPQTLLATSGDGAMAAYVDGHGWCAAQVLRRGLIDAFLLGDLLFVASPQSAGVKVEVLRRVVLE